MYQGQDIRPLNAGILHEYVQLYFMLDQPKKAAAIGQKILDNYKTVIAYFEYSDIDKAGNEENAEDLIAVADALLKMRSTFQQVAAKGTAKDAFSKDLERTIQLLYKKVLPQLYNELEQAASENGEMGMGEGLYSNRLGRLKTYMSALAEHHGLIKAPVVNRSNTPPPADIDINALSVPTAATDTNRMMQ